MNVLIADKFEQSGRDGLASLGCEVVFDPGITAETLAQAVAEHDPDVIIVRSTKVQKPALEAAKSLGLIVRAGAGYDTIDVAEASARGIFVANCPGRNSIAVAELAWALILACNRRLPEQTADLRARKWNKKEYSRASGLYGRTLGIIGLGQIGREVVKRGLAFGMNVVAWSRSLTPEKAEELGIDYVASPIDVAKMSDVVSVHIAATGETRGMINADFFDAMKPGACLVNTSRGSIVDEVALRDAIHEKAIRAGLDVYASEPGAAEGEFTDPIVNEPGVCGTHHIGASTDQAQEAIAAETVRIVEHYTRTGQVLNCVNIARATPATTVLTVRMLNRPGVLAHVFYILGQASVNVEEMNNIVYEGAKATCAHIQLDNAPDEELLTAIRANPNVLTVSVSML